MPSFSPTSAHVDLRGSPVLAEEAGRYRKFAPENLENNNSAVIDDVHEEGRREHENSGREEGLSNAVLAGMIREVKDFDEHGLEDAAKDRTLMSKDKEGEARGDEKKELIVCVNQGEVGEKSQGQGECDKCDDEALDGGWGYVVVIGTFIVMMSVGITSQCFSILFLGFLNQRGTSSTLVASIFNAESFVWCLANFLGGPLVQRFGWRRVGVVAGVLPALGLSLSAFAPSAVYLLFSHSFLLGLGSGLSSLVSYAIIPFYFKRLRGRASGLMTSGVCLGGMLGPPAITYVQEEYGFRGATLIVAAFTLNNCAAAAVFHPVTWHKRKSVEKPGNPQSPSNAVRGVSIEKDYYDKNIIKNSKEEEGSTGNAERMGLTELKEVKSHGTNGKENNNPLTDEHGTAKPKMLNAHEPATSAKNSSGFGAMMRALFCNLVGNLGIMRTLSGFILSFATSISLGLFLNFRMLVPFAMEAEGYSQEEISWSLSVSSVCNLAAKLLVTSVADHPRFNVLTGYILGTGVMALGIIGFCFVERVVMVGVLQAVYGVGVGISTTLFALLLVSYTGLKKYIAIHGVANIVSGVWLILSGSILGVIRDLSGSYTLTLCILAATALVAITSLIFLPRALVWDRRKEEEEKEKQRQGKPGEKDGGMKEGQDKNMA